MLTELCAREALHIGHLFHEGTHIDCADGHIFALTSKTMAVGNAPDQDGPNDDFLAEAVPVLGSDGGIIGWSAGAKVAPLSAPFNCPQCGKPLTIT